MDKEAAKEKRRIDDSSPTSNEQQEREATGGVESANETQLLKCGMLVACFIPKYKEEEPQIGTVVSVPDKNGNLEIEWMTGTYSEPWMTCQKKSSRKKCTMERENKSK